MSENICRYLGFDFMLTKGICFGLWQQYHQQKIVVVANNQKSVSGREQIEWLYTNGRSCAEESKKTSLVEFFQLCSGAAADMTWSGAAVAALGLL